MVCLVDNEGLISSVKCGIGNISRTVINNYCGEQLRKTIEEKHASHTHESTSSHTHEHMHTYTDIYTYKHMHT